MLPYHNLKMYAKGMLCCCIFPLVVSGRGRYYPLRLASGTSDSEPYQGEYPHSHM